jgi:hypothetical protein
MRKIAIIGAGRVGVACASLITQNLEYEVHLIDTNPDALSVAQETVGGLVYQHLVGDEMLEAQIASIDPWAVICATPFHINIRVAGVCDTLGAHYIDFTEDVKVKNAVKALNPQNSAFILQTGLAPGLISQIGLHLNKQIIEDGCKPFSIELRVGALPQNGDYALTWSTAGLVNEYMQPCERIWRGRVSEVKPLEDHENLLVDCGRTTLEAFNTSGGMGDSSMYDAFDLEFVDYKTMRYPGHLEFVKENLVPYMQYGLDKGIERAEQIFNFTRQDVVHLFARAVGSRGSIGFERTYYKAFTPVFGLTALELTTAGTGVAMLELLEADKIAPGIVFGGAVPYEDIRATKVGSRFMDVIV